MPDIAAMRSAVVGYASIDFKYLTAPFRGVGRTTIISQPVSAQPEPGAAWYFARAMAQYTRHVSLVSWVGEDRAGEAFRGAVNSHGLRTDSLSQRGARSPSCHMYYAADGDTVVYYDPGDVDFTLTERQRAALGEADVVLIGIGPAAATEQALDCVSDGAIVGWAVKADPTSLTKPLAKRLFDRASLICLNESERAFLRDDAHIDLALAPRGVVVAMTRGADGVTIRVDDREIDIPAPQQILALDATGAGDTFAGSLLMRATAANLFSGDHRSNGSVRAAVEGACVDAAELLTSRTERYQR